MSSPPQAEDTGLNRRIKVYVLSLGYSNHCLFESWFLTLDKTLFCITSLVLTRNNCSVYIHYIHPIELFHCFFNFQLIRFTGNLKSIAAQFILLAICFFG